MSRLKVIRRHVRSVELLTASDDPAGGVTRIGINDLTAGAQGSAPCARDGGRTPVVGSAPMLRLVVPLLLLALACREADVSAVAETTTSAAPTATAEAPFDPTGAYFSMIELPAEFADLDHLLLATIDENAAPAPLNGFLRPKKQDAQDFTLVNPVIDGRKLTFATIAVDGVSYQFDGAFEVTGDFAANPPSYETAALAGTLTKLRDGRSVASTPVRFRYEAGG